MAEMTRGRNFLAIVLYGAILFIGIGILLPDPLAVKDPTSFLVFLRLGQWVWVAGLLIVMPVAFFLSTLVVWRSRPRWVAFALLGEAAAFWLAFGNLNSGTGWAAFAFSMLAQYMMVRRFYGRPRRKSGELAA